MPINARIQTWWQQVRSRLPERDICLVPADAFYVRSFTLPDGLPPREAGAFAALSLETHSPFPIEQLCWGYLSEPGCPYILVYASPRNRLKKAGIEDLSEWFHTFPGFISISGESRSEPTIVRVCQNGILSAVFLDKDFTVPTKIYSRRIDADQIDAVSILQTWHKMQNGMATQGYTLEPTIWLGAGSRVTQDDRCRFQHWLIDANNPADLADEPGDSVLPLKGDAVWAADLRDDDATSKEASARQTSRRVWNALLSAGAAAVFLLIWQIALFGIDIYSQFQSSNITNLEGPVRRVENKLTLAERLTRSVEQDIQPFRLLSGINQPRPASVFYTRVRSEAFNQLRIEGESEGGVSPLNLFATEVESLPFVSSVENQPQTRNNITTFELVIRFSELPPRPEPEPEPEPEEEIPTEEESEAEPEPDTISHLPALSPKQLHSSSISHLPSSRFVTKAATPISHLQSSISARSHAPGHQ